MLWVSRGHRRGSDGCPRGGWVGGEILLRLCCRGSGGRHRQQGKPAGGPTSSWALLRSGAGTFLTAAAGRFSRNRTRAIYMYTYMLYANMFLHTGFIYEICMCARTHTRFAYNEIYHKDLAYMVTGAKNLHAVRLCRGPRSVRRDSIRA